jgi:hypothetical protein
LGADGINESDVFAIWIAINVVATGKSFSGGKRGGEQDSVRAFDGHEVFAHN